MLRAIRFRGQGRRNHPYLRGRYRREGVLHYCISDPETRVAKIYRLEQGRYIQQADVSSERVRFELGKCGFEFDFSKIWP